MNASNRGMKHDCPECDIKYYDMGKDAVVCPSCGAKPAPPKLTKTRQPAKKAARSTFGR